MRIRSIALAAGLLLVLVGGSGSAVAADDDTADLPEGILAKMARMRAKGELAPRERDTDETGRRNPNAAACGSLNIGNVEAGKPGTRAPKEVFVYVKGPVVNADNKCPR